MTISALIKQVIIVLSLLSMLASCRSVQMADLRVTGPEIPVRLLPIKADINRFSFNTFYSKVNTGPQVIPEYENGGSPVRIYEQVTVYSDDAMVLLTSEVEDNISTSTKQPLGKLTLRITQGELKFGPSPFFIPSAILLSVPFLFGAPYMEAKEELEIEAVITGLSGTELKRYRLNSLRKNNTCIFCKWSNLSVLRATNLEAIKDILVQLRGKISKDAVEINSLLKEESDKKSDSNTRKL